MRKKLQAGGKILFLVCIFSLGFNGLIRAGIQAVPVKAVAPLVQGYVASFTKVQTAPNTISFTSTSTGTGSSTMYSWNTGDSTYGSYPVAGPAPNVSHTFNIPGLYTVCLTIWDSTVTPFVYSKYCDTVHVSGTLICTLSVTEQQTESSCISCADGTAYANVYGGTAPYTYSWSPAGGTGGNASGLVSGTYTVCVDDANGCHVCGNVNVNYNINCKAGFGWVQTNPNVIQFTSADSAAASYATYYWDFGDAGSSVLQNPLHTYTKPGTYTVNKTVKDSSGLGYCYSSVSNSISVTGTSLCTMYIVVAATPASCNACSNGSDSVTVFNGTMPYTYSWSNGYSGSALMGISPGTYSVCVTDVSGCSACKSGIVGYTSGPHNCSANYTLVSDTLNPGNYTILNLATGSGPLTYDWNWGDNTPHDTIAAPTHTYAGSGLDYVCLTMKDSAGCTASLCDTLTAARFPSWAPAVIHTTIHVIRPSSANGIKEYQILNEWNIYPNPACGSAYIQYSLNKPGRVSVELFDLSGRQALETKQFGQQETGAHQWNLDVSGLPAGTYFLRMSENGQSETKLFHVIR